MNERPNIVLFDGVCNLCNGAVQFILARDDAKYFSFASLQSVVGQELQKQYGVLENVDSIVLVENGKAYTHSDAALGIAKHLHGLSWISAFAFVPKFLRDWFYNLLAKNRYRLFGKRESCWLPTPELRSRFLDTETG